MGVFNFFITGPQIINGIFGSPIVKHFFNGQAVYALVMAGGFMILAALSVLFVEDGKKIQIIREPAINPQL